MRPVIAFGKGMGSSGSPSSDDRQADGCCQRVGAIILRQRLPIFIAISLLMMVSCGMSPDKKTTVTSAASEEVKAATHKPLVEADPVVSHGNSGGVKSPAGDMASAGLKAADGYVPIPGPGCSGIRDLMLFIIPSKRPYNVKEVMPYVAYLDKAKGGKPVDWFYDAFQFMPDDSVSGQPYGDGATDMRDWKKYLDRLFEPNVNLAALDDAYAEAGKTLGVPPRPCQILIVIPNLSPRQKAFGDVDGSGRILDFSKPEDATAGARWFVAEGARRFKAAGYRHLSLWGYYWMPEEIGAASEPYVKATAKVVHDHGFKFLWIPWFKSTGFERWHDFGFDLAVLQPNYVFTPLPRNEQRLSDTAALCRRHHMGIEIELPYQLLSSVQDRDALCDTLDFSQPACEGYMNTVHAYFQGWLQISDLYHSEIAANNALYRGLYLFHKGQYTSMDRSVVRGLPCELIVPGLPACRSTALTTRSRQNPLITIPGSGATLWIELPTPLRVAELHLKTDEDGVPPFFRARVYACQGRDDAGQLLVDGLVSESCGEDNASTALLGCRPRPARLLRVDFSGPEKQQTSLKWIRVLGAGGLNSEGSYACDGQGATGTLTDGRYAPSAADSASLVQWPQRAGSLTFDVPSGAHLEKLWLHFVKVPGGGWPTKITANVGSGTIQGSFGIPLVNDWGAYATVDLPRDRASQIVIDFHGTGTLAMDEVEFEPERNLALGQPYVFEPAQRSPNADAGRRLTDGHLSNGLGDGNAVGWDRGRSIDMILDLGQSHPIEKMRAHVQGGGAGWSFLPLRVTAFTSVNGEDWAPVFERVILQQEPLEFKNRILRWLDIEVPGTAARYVKLSFVKSYAWLNVNEIEVISNGRNVALNKPCRLLPRPMSQGYCIDDGCKLTNGAIGTTENSDFVVLCESGDPSVTVDLTGPKDIGLVAAHVLGGGAGDRFLPAEMSVTTSLNGVTWMPAVVTREIPAEGGRNPSSAWLEVKLEAKARYVRYHFKRHGVFMVDEVQVFAPR